MKMKKLLMLLLALVLTFSMTACSDGKEHVEFDYSEIDILSNSIALSINIQGLDDATKMVINNTEGQDAIRTAISNFETAEDECGTFKGFRTVSGDVVTLKDIAKSETDEEFLQYLMIIDSEVFEDGKYVRAKLNAVYEKRDVYINFAFEGAPSQASIDESTGMVNIPFKVAEITVSPEYTFKEIMSQAAMNTLMGMGTVFAVLIIIAVIIGQFERMSAIITKVADAIGALINKFKEKRAAKNAGKTEEATVDEAESTDTAAPGTAAPDNLINDSELVAVITAAIMASQGSTLSAGSDGLIVRSIKKAKR